MQSDYKQLPQLKLYTLLILDLGTYRQLFDFSTLSGTLVLLKTQLYVL